MTTLKQLSEKIQSRFNRLTGLTLPITQVKNTIKTISTDYANFTPEQQQQVMDILKDKNDSQIQNASGISDDEIETVRLDEQTLDNITGDNDMMESNDNNKMVKAESTAITFEDDFEKTLAVVDTLKANEIALNRKQTAELSKNIEDDFESENQFSLAVLSFVEQNYFSEDDESIKTIASKISTIKERMQLNYFRKRQMITYGFSDIKDTKSKNNMDIAMTLIDMLPTESAKNSIKSRYNL